MLYGSESGESQAAAERIAKNVALCLCPEAVALMTGYDSDDDDNNNNNNNEEGNGGDHSERETPRQKGPLPQVLARLYTLNDFLRKKVRWTRNVVIVVSTFNEGEAPGNAVKFRRFCDSVLKLRREDCPDVLKGIHFHLLGFGDSTYGRTYLKNPIIIDQALQRLGAERVGNMGTIDADKGSQQAEVRRWIKAMWLPLAHGIVDRGSISKQQLDACSSSFTRFVKDLKQSRGKGTAPSNLVSSQKSGSSATIKPTTAKMPAAPTMTLASMTIESKRATVAAHTQRGTSPWSSPKDGGWAHLC